MTDLHARWPAQSFKGCQLAGSYWNAEVCLDTDADDLQVGPIDSQPRPAA